MQLRALAKATGLEIRLEAVGYVKCSAPASNLNKFHEEGMFVAPFDSGIPGHRLVMYSKSTGGVLRSVGEKHCFEPGVPTSVPADIRALRSAKQTILLQANMVGHTAACHC
jgi:hypothetical protein